MFTVSLDTGGSSLPVKQGTSTTMVDIKALITGVCIRDLPALGIDHTTLSLRFQTDFRKIVHESNYKLVVECSV